MLSVSKLGDAKTKIGEKIVAQMTQNGLGTWSHTSVKGKGHSTALQEDKDEEYMCLGLWKVVQIDEGSENAQLEARLDTLDHEHNCKTWLAACTHCREQGDLTWGE